MADGNGSFIDMSKYSDPIAAKGSAVVDATAAKQDAVSDASRMKTFLMTSPEEMHIAATATLGGNLAGDDPMIQDLRSLNRAELTAKYGEEAMLKAGDFYGAVLDLRKFNDRERTWGQVAKDSALDAGIMAVNTAGGAGILGALITDNIKSAPAKLINLALGEGTVNEPTAMAPLLSEGLGLFNETARGYQSQLKQERAAQHQLEGALNQADRAATYDAETASMEEGFSADKTGAWFAQQGGDFVDGVGNYADDPIMLGSLVPEMVGSMMPSTLAIKAAGKIGAVSALARQGITGEAASAVMKSAAGRALAGKEGLKAAMPVIGVTESGSAVSQVQQEMMAKTEADMLGNEQYEALRNQGLSHEESLNQLASTAGSITALTALPLAMAAGKFNAKFDANPLGTLSPGMVGSALVGGAKNVAKETVEETIQEGSNALAVNVGMNAAGEEVPLDRGVASGAAEGFVGGMMGTAAMQAPGVALGSLQEVGKPVLAGISSVTNKVIDARLESAAQAADDQSAVGTKQLAEASTAAAANADAIIASLAPTPVAPVEAPVDGAPAAEPVAPVNTASNDVLSTAIDRAIYLDAGETAAALSDYFPDRTAAPAVEGQPAPRIQRAEAIAAAGKQIQDPKATDEQKRDSAFFIMGGMDAVRAMDSDGARSVINALPADHPARAKQAELSNYVKLQESAPAYAAAVAELKKLTPDDIAAMLPVDMMKAGTLPPAAKSNIRSMLEMVGRTNAGAVDAALYDTVRNQVTPNDTTPTPADMVMDKSLDVSRDIALLAQKSDVAKAEIRDTQAAEFAAKGFTPAQSNTHTPKDIVREQIYTAREQKEDPNRQGKLSLAEYRRTIGEDIAAGRLGDARVGMENLWRFATSMNNKAVAINTSADNKDNTPVMYAAYGPYGAKPYTPKKGVYANEKSINSVANAVDVHVDATAVAGTYNTLRAAYGQELGLTNEQGPIAVADLHPRMRAAHDAAVARLIGNKTADAAVPVDTSVADEQAEIAAKSKIKDTKIAEAEAEADRLADEAKTEAAAKVARRNEDTSFATDESIAFEEAAAQTKAAVEAEPFIEAVEAYEQALEDAAAEPAKSKEFASKTWFRWLNSTALTGLNQVNKFVTSFKPKNNGSSFLEHESAADFVAASPSKLMTNTNGMDYALNDDQSKSIIHLMTKLLPTMTAAIQTKFDAALTKERGGQKAGSRISTWMGDLEKGTADVLNYKNAMSANFAIVDAEGKYALEPRVLEAAVMSALEWVMLNNTRGKPRLADDQVGSILGLPNKYARIEGNMREVAQSGAMVPQALQDIATTMMDLLGVEPNRNVSASYTQGLFRSMASNALLVLVEGGVIQGTTYEPATKPIAGPVRGITLKKQTFNTKTYTSLSPIEGAAKSTDLTQKAIRDFARMPDVFSRIFLLDGEKERYIGKAPKKVAQSLIRNSFSATSQKQQDVIQDRQNAPYKMNMPVVDLWKAMGSDLLGSLLGYVELTPEKLKVTNKVKATKIKGKNDSITSDMAGVQGYLDAANQYAETTGETDVSKVKIFFGWAMSSVGRLQQQGPVTPQGNKITREMITITNATVDLLDPEGDAGVVGDLWLAIAQSVGIKIEKLTRQEAINGSREGNHVIIGAKTMLLEGVLTPAVDILMEYERTKTMSQAQKKALEAAIKGSGLKITMKLIHAIHTVARMELALEQGIDASSSFETSLALEADGKTDGPINAIIHMATGAFDKLWLSNVAKGGWFFGRDKKTLNEHIKVDPNDLYDEARHAFNANLKAHISSLEGQELDYAMSLLRAMNALLPGFTISTITDADGNTALDFGIDRDVTKNPLTVFLYGSKVGGISGKVLSAMEESLYSMLSEVAASGKSWDVHPMFQENPGLLEDLNLLFGTQVDKDGAFSKLNNQTLATQMLNKPVEAELSSYVAGMLTQGITNYFGKPLIKAIDEATGSLASNMQFTQMASQVQALIFTDVFNKLLAQRLSAYQAKTGTKLMLPENEMADVFRAAMRIAPIYETDDMEFHISGKESGNSGTEVSTSLDGNFSGSATIPTAGKASVKISPYMTIGLGDGQLILNIYADENGNLKATLPVFDGVEIAVDKIRRASEHINKSVYNAWMGSNIYRSISDGFDQMMLRFDLIDPTTGLVNLSADTLKGLSIAMGLKSASHFSQIDLDYIQETLSNYADEVEARKEAMAALNSWVDHMAGIGSPHNNPGEMLDEDQVLDRLNDLYEEALARIQAKSKKISARPATQAHTTKNLAVVRKLGQPVDGFSSTYMLRGTAAIALVTEALGASPEQVELMRLIEKSGALKNLQIFRGSARELTRLKRRYFPNLDKTPIQEGQAFVGSGIIFLTNASPETVLHEAIHAFTSRAVTDFYRDPASVPANIREAVTRLEALMQEFMKVKSASLPQNMRVAYDTLRSQLVDPAKDRAEKIDEFLAWTLSNQNLTLLAQKVRVHNPVARLARAAVDMLAKLLGIKLTPGKDLFSNVRFNAQVLGTYSPTRAQAELAGEVEKGLNQVYGSDPRLQDVESRFLSRMQAHLQATIPAVTTPASFKEHQEAVAQIKLMAQESANHAIQQGFNMNEREQAAFTAVHAVMMSGMGISAPILSKANKLYDHVLKNLKESDFLALDGLTEETASDADYTIAASRVAVFTGDLGFRTTADGRSDMLATFMALAQVHPDLRAVLEKMDAPKDADFKWDSVDNALRSVGTTAVNTLTRFSVSRAKQPKNVSKQLDILSDALSEVETTHRLLAAVSRYNPVETANDYLADKLEKGTKAAVAFLDRKSKAATNNKVAGTIAFTKIIVSLGSKETSTASGEFLSAYLNAKEGWHTVRELLNDMRGMTSSNQGLFRLMNQVKSAIDAVRQDFREQVPTALANAFGRKLKKHEWSRLHQGLARADMLALGKAEVLDLLANPTTAADKILDAEELMSSLAKGNATIYREKAKALATYMVKRDIVSNNLQTNAFAIAHLAGEASLIGSTKVAVTDDLVIAIDRLTSLYAYEMLDQPTKDTLTELAQNEAKGMLTVSGYLEQTRQAELDRLSQNEADVGTMVSRINGLKGYVPSTVQEGAVVIIDDDSQTKKWVRLGYTKMGAYLGDANGNYRGSRSYFQNTVGTRNAFRQGVAQTVHTSWQGVDVRTGLTQGPDTSGVQFGAKAKDTHSRVRISGFDNNLKPDLQMLPVYDADKNVAAYEWPVANDQLVGLARDTHLGRMLGVWAGRISEENQSDHFNKELLGTLKANYDARTPEQNVEYVNLADPNLKDKVYVDAWDTLGWRIKRDAAELYGKKNFFPVRRDMINDAVGYRSAGFTDAFTGTTRWSEETQNKMERAATLIFRTNVYAKITRNEDRWQGVVSWMKTNIVVRSLEVVASNVLGNNYYLLLSGVNPLKVLRGNRDKFLEVTAYVKNREQILALEVELSGLREDAVQAKSLKARIMAYQDANAQLSIQPLIRAGELSTVSENLTEADVAIREGKLGEKIEEWTSRLPGFSKTIAKNLLVTKDTALYQGLNRAVQYGDFVAKAILYEHLTKEKGKTEREALDIISEEFVNYNRLSGRGRDFLESIGMLWFYNYKLRISKIAVKMVRDRPLNALLMASGSVTPLGLDTPFDSSVFGKIAEGSLDYSIGPQMGFHSFGITPLGSVIF